MRRYCAPILLLFVTVSILYGCGAATEPQERFDDYDRTGPPPIPFSAVAEAQPSGDGVDLVVTIGLHNSLSIPLLVYTTPSCAPLVILYPNSDGKAVTHLNMSMVCPKDSPATSVAPGDSIRLVRRLTPSELAVYPPGKYLVEAAWTTSIYASGVSLGNFDLPLTIPR